MFKNTKWKKYSSKTFFFATIIGGTLLSSPFEFYARGGSVNVFGSSTILYAIYGVVLATAFINLKSNSLIRKINIEKNKKMNFEEWLVIPLNLFVIIIVAILVFSPNFLGVNPETGKISHGSSFIAGMFISYIALYCKSHDQYS